MMYGKEPVTPWELEYDMGPLETEEDVILEETIVRMTDIWTQMLDVAAANITKAQAHQAKTYNAKHARNLFEIGDEVWRKNPKYPTKQNASKISPR